MPGLKRLLPYIILSRTVTQSVILRTNYKIQDLNLHLNEILITDILKENACMDSYLNISRFSRENLKILLKP
jgi:hypothetical protein